MYRVNFRVKEFGDYETEFEDVEAKSPEEAIELIKKYLIDSIIDNGYKADTKDDEIIAFRKGKIFEEYDAFKAVKRRG